MLALTVDACRHTVVYTHIPRDVGCRYCGSRGVKIRAIDHDVQALRQGLMCACLHGASISEVILVAPPEVGDVVFEGLGEGSLPIGE
jgi:hypothetical protein